MTRSRQNGFVHGWTKEVAHRNVNKPDADTTPARVCSNGLSKVEQANPGFPAFCGPVSYEDRRVVESLTEADDRTPITKAELDAFLDDLARNAQMMW